MNELDCFALRDVPRDWNDVLCRAGLRRRPRRRLVVAAVALALVAAAAPAAALVGVFSSGPPMLRLAADLGGGATSEFRAFGFIGHGRNGAVPMFRHVGNRFARRGLVAWSLRVGGPVEQAVVRRHGSVLLRLCGPCPAHARGIRRLTPSEAGALFGGETTIEVRTSSGTRTAPIRLVPRR